MKTQTFCFANSLTESGMKEFGNFKIISTNKKAESQYDTIITPVDMRCFFQILTESEFLQSSTTEAEAIKTHDFMVEKWRTSS